LPLIADRVLDNGLTVLDTEANVLHLCSQEPANYAQATSTYTLGNKTGLSVGAPAARAGSGRKVTVATFTDGIVTADGSGTHWAIVDTVNLRLLAVGSLSAPLAVTNGGAFGLSAFDIGIPGPA
jgi:hypothetical protein